MRPRRCRCIDREPEVTYFKPQGVPVRELEIIELKLEEYEALRLKDHEKLDQHAAAEKMTISQPTFHRLYQEAREKIAKALVEGLAIKITGGDYMPRKDGTGPEGKGPRTGRGFGRCSPKEGETLQSPKGRLGLGRRMCNRNG